MTRERNELSHGFRNCRDQRSESSGYHYVDLIACSHDNGYPVIRAQRLVGACRATSRA